MRTIELFHLHQIKIIKGAMLRLLSCHISYMSESQLVLPTASDLHPKNI